MTLLIIALAGGGLISIYFLVHKALPLKLRNWFPKELLISTGYMIGTFGLPFLTKTKPITRTEVLIITCYFLLVFSNVLIYSFFDFEEDKQSGFVGIIQVLGIKSGYKVVLSFVIVSDILCLYLLFNNPTSIIILLVSVGISFIVFKPATFSKNQLYGKIADALFLLPGLIILIG